MLLKCRDLPVDWFDRLRKNLPQMHRREQHLNAMKIISIHARYRSFGTRRPAQQMCKYVEGEVRIGRFEIVDVQGRV
jgi:hypothetical protein